MTDTQSPDAISSQISHILNLCIEIPDNPFENYFPWVLTQCSKHLPKLHAHMRKTDEFEATANIKPEHNKWTLGTFLRISVTHLDDKQAKVDCRFVEPEYPHDSKQSLSSIDPNATKVVEYTEINAAFPNKTYEYTLTFAWPKTVSGNVKITLKRNRYRVVGAFADMCS